MTTTKDLFYSGKVREEQLVGENNFFKSNNEIVQYQKKQERFLSNIDFATASNFTKFGSAEEYYKNAISYINADYPFDNAKEKKIQWINELNDLEYYIFLNEYPRHAGIIYLTSSQHVKIFSPNQEYTGSAVETYNNGIKFFTSASLSFNTGFAFDSWLNFPSASIENSVFSINTVNSSSVTGLSSSTFVLLKTNSSKFVVSGTAQHTFDYAIPSNEWHHYAINFNSNSLELFVDGQLTQSLKNINLRNDRIFSFSKIGILSSSFLTSWSLTGSFTPQPAFQIGGNSLLLVDECKFWNEPKTVEHYGRNWFTTIDGNDFTDPYNNNLIFYYKFNEGWSSNGDICLDYSGRENDGQIHNYFAWTTRFSGSAINSSSLTDYLEGGDPIKETSLSNTGVLKNYYDSKILLGAEFDETNMHALYKKFPSWILEDEQELQPKHLKQLVQIISSYFDDLYIKIKEISNFKHIQNTSDLNKVYPFYDKILASTGFDFTDIFTNVEAIEKISSRSENNVFDEDIEKVKNVIYQNIYNNLIYILKSKGTRKSLRAFLRSYGLNENLIKINLYTNNGSYDVANRSYQTTIKKKTVRMQNSSSIFHTSSLALSAATSSFSFEAALSFPKDLFQTAPFTSSLFGFDLSDFDRQTFGLRTFAYLVNDATGSKFHFYTGSISGNTASLGTSPYFFDLYDGSTWNFVIRSKKNDDIKYGSQDFFGYNLELTGTSYNIDGSKSFFITGSVPDNIHDVEWLSNSYINFYVGAKNTSYSGSNIIPTYQKVLFCNFWDDYLSDEEIVSHNKDITNYGVSE